MDGKELLSNRLSIIFKIAKAQYPLAIRIIFPLLLVTPLYPTIFAKVGDAYPTPFEDSDYYLAKILSVANGDLMQSDAYFPAQTQSRNFNFEFLGEIINGILIKLSFGNIAIGIIIFLIVLLGLQVHWLLHIFGKKIIPFSVSLLFFYTLQVLVFPNFIYRLINPVLPITLLMAYISYNRDGVDKKLPKLTIIALLSMVTNIFFGATIFLHLLFSSIPRKFLAVLVPIGMTLFFSISWFNFNSISEDLWRWGAISSHLPGSFFVTILGIALVSVFKIFSGFIPTLRNLIYLILIALLLTNSQLILGIYIENSSHFGSVIEILGLIGAGMMVYAIVDYSIIKNSGLRFPVVLLMSPILFFSTLLVLSVQENFINEIHSSKALRVAIPDLPKCTGVSLPDELSEIFPKYSRCPILYGKSATAWFSMSNEEVMERWLLNRIIQDGQISNCRYNRAYDSDLLFRDVFERRYYNLRGRIATANTFGFQRGLISTFNSDLDYVLNLYDKVGKRFQREGCQQILAKYGISHRFLESRIVPIGSNYSTSNSIQ